MKPKTKWALVYSVIGIAQPLAALFPIAWLLKFLKEFNPLWIVLDDSRLNPDGSLAADYAIHLRQFKVRWLGILDWHILRNRVWNFVELFNFSLAPLEGPGNQDIIITRVISNNLYRYVDGKEVRLDIGGPWALGAGLKYVGEPGEDPWQVNRGEVISGPHSIFGDAEFEFTDITGEFKGWRKMHCKIVKPWYLFGGVRYRTLYKGMNSKRYAFKWKHQKVVLMQTTDWTKQ